LDENREILRRIIAEFDPEDVYNMDKTGLFYCRSPTTTISKKKFSGKKVNKKKAFNRILFQCNWYR